jgi:ABC-type transporter Mla subunit MlaD
MFFVGMWMEVGGEGSSLARLATSLSGMEASLAKSTASLAKLTASLARSDASLATVVTSLQGFLQQALQTILSTPPLAP